MTQDQIVKLHWHANTMPHNVTNANEKVTVQSWHARKNQLASQCRCVRQRQLAIECWQANKGQLAVQK